MAGDSALVLIVGLGLLTARLADRYHVGFFGLLILGLFGLGCFGVVAFILKLPFRLWRRGRSVVRFVEATQAGGAAIVIAVLLLAILGYAAGFK